MKKKTTGNVRRTHKRRTSSAQAIAEQRLKHVAPGLKTHVGKFTFVKKPDGTVVRVRR